MNLKTTRSGFTLMETILALFISAIGMGFFLAAFAPASIGIQKANSIQDAARLVHALEAELNSLRASEIEADTSNYGDGLGQYVNHFEKAFYWTTLDGVQDGSELIVAFNYRADAHGGVNADGLRSAYDPTTNSHIVDDADQLPVTVETRLVDMATLLADSDELARFNQAVGTAFVVDLVQLVGDANSGSISPHTSSAEVIDPTNTASAAITLGTDLYPSTSLMMQANFYLLKANAESYLRTISAEQQQSLSDALGKPIYSTQIGIIR